MFRKDGPEAGRTDDMQVEAEGCEETTSGDRWWGQWEDGGRRGEDKWLGMGGRILQNCLMDWICKERWVMKCKADSDF